MKTFSHVVKDEVGLHARPAGLIAKEAKKFKSNIKLLYKGKSVEVTRFMSVMGLGVKNLDEIMISIEGSDEDVALQELRKFFELNI